MNTSPDPGRAGPHDRVRIGQLWVDAVTFTAALTAIEALVRAGRGGSVFTPNVDHVVTAEDDPRFREAYAAASLSLADGMPIIWASRLLGTPLPEKVSGSDLIDPLLAVASRSGWRVFLLGGAPGVAAQAAQKVGAEYGVHVVGTSSPYLRLDGSPGDLEQGLAEVEAARPDLLLVAMGAPKQEVWIHHNRKRLGATVSVGVGASLDFIVGRIRRAPRWMSRVGLEWLYRLLREPRRLAYRYLVKDTRFFPIVARTARSPRTSRVITPS